MIGVDVGNNTYSFVGRGGPVLSVPGETGFRQYAMEMTAAVKYGMNPTHALMNNSELGKISMLPASTSGRPSL